ncbi:MAG TPA: NIPSNAP family protein [Puia sp.]|nr:NIPSNAP family protein [Puia sp.]
MKKIMSFAGSLSGFFALLLLFSFHTGSALAQGEYYQIKIYQLKTPEQEARVDKFLQNAFIPAMHRAGVGQVGVFKPLSNDTAAIRRVYVFMPFSSLDQWTKTQEKLEKDQKLASDGADYVDAAHTDPPYLRIESILLHAFTGMPRHAVPDLKGPKNERIYELRSYEGATEKKYANKVDMFNKGDEVGLFKRLGFNAVFYAEVISGNHMPNLMYMTTFDNMTTHDQHWKSFGDDPYWKKLVAMPEYQNNVSHADIVLMHPTEYSEL